MTAFERKAYRMRNGHDARIYEITVDNRLLGCCTQTITGSRVAMTWDSEGRSLGYDGGQYDLIGPDVVSI